MKLGVINIPDMKSKKRESPCLFTRHLALKMGYFYWFRVKNSNHLDTESSLGYLEDAQFYLGSKASFMDVNSVASFKHFLIPWFQFQLLQLVHLPRSFKEAHTHQLTVEPSTTLTKCHVQSALGLSATAHQPNWHPSRLSGMTKIFYLDFN